MDRLLKFCLLLVAAYLALHAFIAIFLHDQFPIALQVTQFSFDQVDSTKMNSLLEASAAEVGRRGLQSNVLEF